MNLFKNASFLHNYELAIQAEWLETNGLGGYASSTVTGCNTRRYHGLLVAATKPPTERTVLISKLDETIVSGDQRFELGCNSYGDSISPTGYQYLDEFRRGLFTEFTYEAEGIRIRKTIAMIHEENTTLIEYEVLKAGKPFTLEFTPLITRRSYHDLGAENHLQTKTSFFDAGILTLMPYANLPEFYIALDGAEFRATNYWYNHFVYTEEQQRGLAHEEDLFSPGILTLKLEEGTKAIVMLSTSDPTGRKARQLMEAERHHRTKIINREKHHPLLKQLVFASSQFIVRRDEDLKTVIAGYHWFTDWSRDTMIALHGLCLTTNRLDDAMKILKAFANSVSEGMLPNRFLDRGQQPEYNNADGTLWYFVAIHQYLEAGGNRKFVSEQLLPVLQEIIDWHYQGTRYGIKAADDHLLFAGEEGMQLTWMDAKVGDWVVTPRIGKAVEINALWYNAHMIYAGLLRQHGGKKKAKSYRKNAKRIKKAFLKVFWNETIGYLNDVVNNDHADTSLRPNQLFAISLCFPLLKGKKAAAILEVTEQKLLTPFGLRSLSPDDGNYRGRYAGNISERDGAYHQGTVWSWLIGPYVDALFNTYGKEAKAKAQRAINPLIGHLQDAGIGSISEIFDGDAPHHPRGCIAQAWSVAELLRVIRQYKLYDFGQSSPEAQESLAADEGDWTPRI